MECYICKSEIKEFDGCMICKDCENESYLCGAMEEAFKEWNITLIKDDYLWINTKKLIIGFIKDINRELDLNKINLNDL